MQLGAGPSPFQKGVQAFSRRRFWSWSGEADLDAQNLGDVFGVFVVEGSVFLDGTVLHGACSAGEGALASAAAAFLELSWVATDRSLIRTRLVPGTRWEGGIGCLTVYLLVCPGERIATKKRCFFTCLADLARTTAPGMPGVRGHM